MFSLLLSLLPLLPAATAFDDDAMRSKKVYQLVTDRFARDDGSTSASCDIRQYCGGTWKGIASKLDYIAGMGFDTVWISPVVDNIEGQTAYGEAYHGYWTRDPDQLNANFGSPEDLRSLAQSLHDKNMYLMLDVVVNHVAATSGQNFQTNSSYGPFSSQDDFHPFCWVDNYENQTNVEQCWLGDDSVVLPDLNTQSQTVVDYWNNWVRNIVSNYTVDAIRIDTVKHVPHEFWTGFTEAAGVANVGEVLYFDPEYIGGYQRNGSVNPFNYAVYYPLTRAFNSSVGSLEEVSQMVRQVAGNSTDPTLYGSFLNNHDNARFESMVTDRSASPLWSQIYNAHTYPFVTDGVPYLYYGSENGFSGGNDPDNREAFWPTNYDTNSEKYLFFKRLNSVRDSAAAKSDTFYRDQMSVTVPSINDMLIVKAPLVSVLTNVGAGAENHTFNVQSSVSSWPANTQVLDVVQCESFTTDGSGNLDVTMSDGMPRVMLAQADAGNVCDGYVKPSTSNGGSGGSGSGGGDNGNGAAGLRSVGSWGVIGLSAVAGFFALL